MRPSDVHAGSRGSGRPFRVARREHGGLAVMARSPRAHVQAGGSIYERWVLPGLGSGPGPSTGSLCAVSCPRQWLTAALPAPVTPPSPARQPWALAGACTKARGRVQWSALYCYYINCKIYKVKFYHFGCAVQWHSVHSYCFAAVTTIRIQNFPSSQTETQSPLHTRHPALSPGHPHLLCPVAPTPPGPSHSGARSVRVPRLVTGRCAAPDPWLLLAFGCWGLCCRERGASTRSGPRCCSLWAQAQRWGCGVTAAVLTS